MAKRKLSAAQLENLRRGREKRARMLKKNKESRKAASHKPTARQQTAGRYRGKYPKRIRTVYSLRKGIIGVELNDGERREFTAHEMGLRMPKPGETITEAKRKGREQYKRDYGKTLTVATSRRKTTTAKRNPARGRTSKRAVHLAERLAAVKTDKARHDIISEASRDLTPAQMEQFWAVDYSLEGKSARKNAESLTKLAKAHEEAERKYLSALSKRPAARRKYKAQHYGKAANKKHYLVAETTEGKRYFSGTGFVTKSRAAEFGSKAEVKAAAVAIKDQLPRQVLNLSYEYS